MTNPEGTPTDMEAALAEARRVVEQPPGTAHRILLNLARCLLASSAEVAALREQVATVEKDRDAWKKLANMRGFLLEDEAREDAEHERTVRADERARVVRALCHRAEEMGEDHAMSEVEEAFSGTPLAVSAALDFAAKWLAFHLGALPKSGAADEPHCTCDDMERQLPYHADDCPMYGYEDEWEPNGEPRTAAPSSEPVERDLDDDSAWPLPEPWKWESEEGDGNGWYAERFGYVLWRRGGTGDIQDTEYFDVGAPELIRVSESIRARNLAARAARTKAAAPDRGES